MLRDVVIRFDNLWRMPFPYVMALHQAPLKAATRRLPLSHRVPSAAAPAEPAQVPGRSGDWRRQLPQRHVAGGEGRRVARLPAVRTTRLGLRLTLSLRPAARAAPASCIATSDTMSSRVRSRPAVDDALGRRDETMRATRSTRSTASLKTSSSRSSSGERLRTPEAPVLLVAEGLHWRRGRGAGRRRLGRPRDGSSSSIRSTARAA